MPDKTSDRKRQLAFKIIAVSIPFVFLVILEVLLRSFHYGYDPSLFMEDAKKPGFVHNNNYISKRFFVDNQVAPASYLQVFKKVKPSDTFRIFVLGESSALGFPYNHRGSFPRMLEYWLSMTFPEKKIEMINLSITAVNSYALLSFTDEIIEMEPDAILIYTGHNEYYGAMGVGSTQRLGMNRGIIRTVLYLKSSRVVQLAMNTVAGIRRMLSTDTGENQAGLMLKVAGEQEIVFGSELYTKGLKQFECNMDELLQEYYEHRIPVFLSDLVSNLKDQKPFASKLKSGTDTVLFLKEYRKGLAEYQTGNYETSLEKFMAADRMDSSYAMNRYLIGEILFRMGEKEKARQYFTAAKELDVLRFRAPEAINSIIRKLGNKYYNVHQVYTKDLFEIKSPGNVMDNSLFTDHLHPNLEGFFLIAEAFYSEIKKTELFGKQNRWISVDMIRQEMPVTAVDSVYGRLVVLFMKEEWPFFEPASFNKDKAKSYPELLGIRMFLKQINWEMAMDSLYRYYLGNGNFPEAIKVAKSVYLEHPYESRLSEEIGKLYLNLRNYKESLYYYKRAFEINPQVETARKIVLILLQLDKLEDSAALLEYLRQKEPNDQMNKSLLDKVREVVSLKKRAVSEPQNIEIQTRLAGYYLYVGNLPEARIHIDNALAINPGDGVTRLLQKEMEKLIAKEKSLP